MSEINNSEKYQTVFKALGDPARLKILALLKSGKTCACKILEAFNFTQPTLSYHMKLLTESGLVKAEKNGKWIYYEIDGGQLKALCEFFTALNK
ncbi:MAG TPA: metalloregulator ArsR/SmtB family transcription factor [Eubacteriales bacterium]|jgi:ArsR family transcriptional regulator|nr:metalloregulator ArsR/SmtB family transcription factor [Clostridia bacterium]HRR89450.1 metalloregulator ArsR/SmtB family transcription factor [Eubacteriales bacterium]HRU83790.1 metalloregulator ArsR/SmtB family transcription factor [Eubacteriales bacterium]